MFISSTAIWITGSDTGSVASRARTQLTPGETENKWQKTEQVPILLLKGARNFFDTKKVKKKFCYSKPLS